MTRIALALVALVALWSAATLPALAADATEKCEILRNSLEAIYMHIVLDTQEEHDNHRYFFRDKDSNLALNWASLVCPREYDERRSLNVWHPLGGAPDDFIDLASKAAAAVYDVPASDMLRDIKRCLRRAKRDVHGDAPGRTDGVTYLCGYAEFNSESNILFDPK